MGYVDFAGDYAHMVIQYIVHSWLEERTHVDVPELLTVFVLDKYVSVIVIV